MDADAIFRCPKCAGAISPRSYCALCGFWLDVIGDVLDLRIDKTMDTLLDVESYDSNHGGLAEASTALADHYYALLVSLGLSVHGHLLEIAAGSGTLTASLLLTSRFSSIHSGDISPAFIERLSQKTEAVNSSTKLCKYLFDANSLPFRDGSFDFVYGNSVLHHLSNFEYTIRDSYRVLRAGGAAVFAEPMMDSHAFVSLVSGMIIRRTECGQASDFTPKHLQTLHVLRQRSSLKMANLASDRSGLQKIEDKFQFPSEFLRRLGSEIGFARVEFEPPPKGFRLGDAIYRSICVVFKQMNLSTDPLDSFSDIFDAFTEDYGIPFANYVYPIFTRIVFVK